MGLGVYMHAADRSVKIIKRAHRHVLDGETDKTEPSAKTDNEIRREIRNTITSWVERQREAKKELYRQSRFLKRETYASSLFTGLKAQSEPELL